MTAELDVGDGWLVSDVSGGVNVTNVTPQLYSHLKSREIKYRAEHVRLLLHCIRNSVQQYTEKMLHMIRRQDFMIIRKRKNILTDRQQGQRLELWKLKVMQPRHAGIDVEDAYGFRMTRRIARVVTWVCPGHTENISATSDMLRTKE